MDFLRCASFHCLRELEDRVRKEARAARSLFTSLTGLTEPVLQSSMPAPVHIQDNIDDAEPVQRLHQLEEQLQFLARVTESLLTAAGELGLYDQEVLWIPLPQLNTDMHRVAQLARPIHDESTAEAGPVI